MKKNNIIQKLTGTIIIFMIVLSLGQTYASSKTTLSIQEAEYTDEYKRYLELSDEEKAKTLEPNKYKVRTSTTNSQYLKELNNTFKVSKLLKNTLSNQYTLQTIIPENMKIKNQMETNTCWAFATTAVLESNLAMLDKINARTVKVYDYSERHMVYGSLRYAFSNGAENTYGLNKKISEGANFETASMYLTNGSGAVPESDLPFENSEANIDISKIKSKIAQTTLYDTVLFDKPVTETEKKDIINQMKQHITNYGGIYAGVHGAMVMSDCYDNQTGALYCNSHNLDHAVMIVGWDDNYRKDNFKEGNRPTNNGAWIIKNSWGEEQSESVAEIKQAVYEANKEACNSKGWNVAEKIPNEIIIGIVEETYGEGKIRIEGDTLYAEIGNKGFMYVSYEDRNIYTNLRGIEKATTTKDYFNLYQNDELGYSSGIILNENEAYIANVFKRDSSVKEAVDKIGVVTLQELECKVYVNPNGNGKTAKDLKQVKLKNGDSITIKPGYRTIELAEPIKLTGSNFVIAIQAKAKENSMIIPIEGNKVKGYENATISSGESFLATPVGFTSNTWTDLTEMPQQNLRGNVCIKALTTKAIPEVEVATLESIKITKAPTKTAYTEGENFNKTGMKVVAKYSDKTEKEITNYTITDGNNLSKGKTSVTISYTEKGITKTTTQAITVEEKGVTPPTPEEPVQKKEPTSSDFRNAMTKAITAQAYFYTNKIEDTYVKMRIKVFNIKLGAEDNKYTYYYYISGKQGEKDIPDNNWKKVEAYKETDGTYSITIDINSKEMNNVEELSESDNMFVYLKEVAEIDNKTKTLTTTMQVENDLEVELYLNGKRVNSLDNTTKEDKEQEDNTVAPGVIPQAGEFSIVLISIVTISAVGVFTYCKFKNIDK